MFHFADDPLYASRLRVMQIIAVALMMGVLLFGMVVGMQVVRPGGAVGELGMLSLIAAGMLGTNLPLAFVLPKVIAQMAVRQLAADPQLRDAATDEQLRLAEALALAGRYITGMTLSYALLEGAAFLGLIAAMQERPVVGMAVAGIALAGMLFLFPTRGRVTRWIDNRQAQIEEIRRTA